MQGSFRPAPHVGHFTVSAGSSSLITLLPFTHVCLGSTDHVSGIFTVWISPASSAQS